MVELTQEEIQELDQHDIERIWPSDEDVATAASTRINREWNPFLSRSHHLPEQPEPEPETPTGSDDSGATSESQSAFVLLSDGTAITDDISTTAEGTAHDSAEKSYNEAFEPFQEADLFGANDIETIKPSHRNAPAAAASAPSGAKTGDALCGERKEGMYGEFSMVDNLLDAAMVDSSLMNSVLDMGGSGGGTWEPLGGNTLGFGLLPQAGNTHTLTQSLRGTTTHGLGTEDLPLPIQDPAIMHVMSHPPAAPVMPVVHEEEGGLGSLISHNHSNRKTHQCLRWLCLTSTTVTTIRAPSCLSTRTHFMDTLISGTWESCRNVYPRAPVGRVRLNSNNCNNNSCNI